MSAMGGGLNRSTQHPGFQAASGPVVGTLIYLKTSGDQGWKSVGARLQRESPAIPVL